MILMVETHLPAVIGSIAAWKLASSGLLGVAVKSFWTVGVLDKLAFALLLAAFFGAVVAFASRTDNSSSGAPFPSLAAGSTDEEKIALLLPRLFEDVLAGVDDEHQLTRHSIQWIKSMMAYNMQETDCGPRAVDVHGTLSDGTLSELEFARAAVLDWAIEFLRTFLRVAEDFVDDADTRTGKECWHRLKNVGKVAINDAFLLESFAFSILKTYFGRESCYARLVDLFLETTQQTELGKLLDLTTQPRNEALNLENFTMERYRSIAVYKNAFCTYYLPTAGAMILSGIEQREAYAAAKDICCKVGEYFQIQNDYSNCFGNPEVPSEVGTDIQDNKCTWLVVQANERASPEQRQILKDNYGAWDGKKVKRVKDVFRELNLKEAFDDYQNALFEEVWQEVLELTAMPKEVFEHMMKINDRVNVNQS